MIERNNYLKLQAPAGPYVHAVKYNGLLFLSGLTAFGTSAERKSIASQAEAIFAQIKTVADAERIDLSNLIKVTIFVTNFDDIAELRAMLFKQYGDHLPASSLIQVSKLFSDRINIEIEATLAMQ